MGFGEFLGAAAGGALGFVLSAGNPAAAVFGAKAGAELVGSGKREDQLREIAKQQQALGQQTIQRGDLIAQLKQE
jgi:hypothetical protein